MIDKQKIKEHMDAIMDELNKKPVFDPMKLKVDTYGYVWKENERPKHPHMRYFSTYLPFTEAYLCFNDGFKRAKAKGVWSWRHFEPIGEDDE